MPIPARIRANLEEINRKARKYMDEGYPPYVAFGKAEQEWEKREVEVVQSEVNALPPSGVQKALQWILSRFSSEVK